MKANKKVIHIENSYNIWSINKMTVCIMDECAIKYGTPWADHILNRTWEGMYIEWWLHNIGYYLTRWMRAWSFMSKINDRCRSVDLEEHL